MIIWSARQNRKNNVYLSAALKVRNIGYPAFHYTSLGWAIRTKTFQESGPFWLVPTGENVTQARLGTTGLEIGPFDSIEAAKAAAVVLINT